MDGSVIDVHPAAREVVDGVASAPTTPTKIAVIGGIGTGKSAILATIRTILRDAGVGVLTRTPQNGEIVTDAIIVDDAHLLPAADLLTLATYVSRAQSTVIIAAEPHQHNSALRDLTRAIENEDSAVLLGPVTPAELPGYASTISARSAGPYDGETLRSLLATTAGVPFLVKSALRAPEPVEGQFATTTFSTAVKFALIERLRGLDERLLDVLLIGSFSRELGATDVAAALNLPSEEAHILVDRAHATGLIAPALPSRFLLSVHGAVSDIVGTARHHEIEIRLLATQLEQETLSVDTALRLAEHGTKDERLARVLEQQTRAAAGDPARMARLYRAAIKAGASRSGSLDSRLADVLALTGDCTSAAGIADNLLGSDDPAQRAAAVRIAASVAAHDGNAAQAGELFRWLGPHPDAFVTACAVIALVGNGDAAAARLALSAEITGPPTSTASAAKSLAEGLMLTLDHPFPVAIARLGQSITTDRSPGVGPDSAAALVTLAAMHGGDPVRARNVIGRAVRAGMTDDDGSPSPAPFAVHRHRLLLGWARMQDGQLSAAAADTVSVVSAAGADLHRRDALWASALQTGIARRVGDTGAIQKYWHSAMEVLAECTVDLFSLMPLGELWVAAARLRQESRLQHTLTEAFALLESLGNPALWAVPLHWAGVHAGILANSPDAVAPHGQALTAASRADGPHSAFALALAGAGRTWLRVLANHVDIDEVTSAARGLSQFGLTWDATRLASQAALQTPDGRVSGAMLQLARDLKQTLSVDDGPEPTAPSTAVGPRESRTGPARPSSSRLSDREREVAELLLLGMPYRDIGSQLFISAKTVEHHVARIRRRLGAESRSEMLSMLRALLASQRTDS